MSNPRQTSITKGLMFGFCTLILIFLLFGVYALYDIHKISQSSRNIYNHPLTVSNAALQANVSIIKMHRSMKDVVLFSSVSEIQQSIGMVNDEEKRVLHQLDIVKKNILGDEGKALENEARKLFEAWQPIRNEVVGLIHTDQRETAADITIGKGARHVVLIEKRMLGLMNYARNKATEFARETEKVHSRLNVFSIFFLIVGILISIFVALWTLKRTKLTEKNLLESEAKYRRVSDNSPAVLYQFMMSPNETFSFLYVSDLVMDIMGISPEDVVKDSSKLLDMVHPEDQEIFREAIMKSAETMESFPVSFRCVKDGEVIWIEACGMPTPLPDGGILWDGYLLDITARKLIEEALQHSAKQYLSLFTSIRDAILVADTNRTIIDCNPAFLDLFGYSKEAVLGKQTLSIYENEEEFRQMGTAIKGHIGDPGFLYTVRYKKKNGSVFLGETNVFYLHNDKGTIVGFIGLIRDITERKLAQEQQDKLIAEIQKALSEVKTLRGFLPICSHCKKIRDDKGYWNQIEEYLHEHSEAEFSHSICQECAEKYYSDLDLYDDEES